MVWRFRTGGQWREMPQEFGAWSTVSNRFRQWRDAGVFEALLEGLIAEAAKRGEVDLSLVSIDSTTVRAHHDAAGMHTSQDVLAALEKAAAEEEEARSKGGGPEGRSGQDGGADPERDERRRVRRRRKIRLKAALVGRSRGGQTSKVHLAADRKCRSLAFVLTGPTAHSSSRCWEDPGPRPSGAASHQAGRGRRRQGVLVPQQRAHLRRRGIKAVIPEKRDQPANRKTKGRKGGRPVDHDAEFYKERNTVERLINKLKAWRRHRDPLRQDPGKLPSRASAACLGDLDQRPHPNQSREPCRSSRGVVCRDRSCGL